MRIPLKPYTGKKRKPVPFSVFDIEAKNWVEFLVLGWYDGNEYHEFRCLFEFIDFIHERREKVIYAHFGGIYDFLFVFQAALEEGDYIIENIIPRGSGMLSFNLVNIKTNHVIKFCDSSALLPFSLKNITESFGVAHKKQDFDVSNIQKITSELLEYLRYDVIGLYEAMEAYYNWPLIKKAGPASTMASQAMKVFRLFMLKEIKSLSKPVDEFVRKGYFGGRTEVFKPEYHGKKKLYCYDVNSLYPFVMRNNEFPTNYKHSTTRYKPDAMGFYEATVEVPKDMYLPPLPTLAEVNDSKKLIFPTGKFDGVWSTIELEYARSLGVKILKTRKGLIFENGGPIFREFIDTLYKMRMEAKEKGDGVGDILTKLLMNSCYGRFGLNTVREQIVFDDFSCGLKEHSEIKVNVNGEEQIHRLMTKETEMDSTFSNVAIPAWVTSLSRIHMHKLMSKCYKELYYTDTDSIFTTKKMPTGDKLGQLKKEYECNKAVFLLPKTYAVEGPEFKKIAMKGFDKKKISKFSYQDFFTALEGDLRHMNVTHDAKFAKFKTAAKKGHFTTLLPEQLKQIKSQYDKRLVVKNGKKFDTRPLHIKQNSL